MTPDGCPVDLWAELPAGTIHALLTQAIPPRSAAPDLGAGAGRLVHPLVDAGHRVTARSTSRPRCGRVATSVSYEVTNR